MEINTNSGDEPKELKTNRVDYSVAVLRAALSPFPWIGPILGEAFTLAIPRQRIDRVAKWLEELAHETRRLDITLSEAMLKNEEIVDLLEEGGLQAARSLSDERRSYIAKVVANGLNAEGIETAESKHLLRILGQLSPVEVIWLCSFREPSFGDGEKYREFREMHQAVLDHTVPGYNTTSDVHDKYALKRSYKEHLAQLGLVYPIYETDHQTDIPKFDKFTGATDVICYRLSGLGRLLLKEIGLGEEE